MRPRRWARAREGDRSFVLLAARALEAADAERAVARRPCTAVPAVRRGGLPADDGALGEEVGAQRRIELRVVPAEPLERHRGVLLLLVTIVGENLLQLVVSRRVDALVVPVDGFQLLAQRRGGAVAVDGVGPQLRGVLVQSLARRHGPSVPAGSVGS